MNIDHEKQTKVECVDESDSCEIDILKVPSSPTWYLRYISPDDLFLYLRAFSLFNRRYQLTS